MTEMMLCRRMKSIKTRIETGRCLSQRCCSVACRRMKSIKTRIETAYKPADELEKAVCRRMKSIKTRIETSVTTHPKAYMTTPVGG